ncbi:MAG: DUF1080 domain-containing protein [Chitinophagaceae bacterium]|nr:DUF1080 domain-containing protein [Chitinophagaceae bacterium]
MDHLIIQKKLFTMKNKISYLLIFLLYATQLVAQVGSVKNTINSFPYQRPSEVETAITSMHTWGSSQWKELVRLLDNDSLKLKPSYALNAYVNDASLNATLKQQLTENLVAVYGSAKTFYTREFIIKQLSLLGDDAAVKLLSSLLKNETFGGNAARALASIHSTASKQALTKALKSASGENAKHIQAALDNFNFILPAIKVASAEKQKASTNAQRLLDLQDRMEKASTRLEKRNVLHEASLIPGFGSFMLVSKSLNDETINKDAAIILARLALADNSIRGPEVRASLERAMGLIRGNFYPKHGLGPSATMSDIVGVDSPLLINKLKEHLIKLPYDNGFVPLFNGKDLTGWKGLVMNPIARAKMSDSALKSAEQKANAKMINDWIAKDGLLVFTGHGDNLATEKKYGDFEMYVDWKITEKGDAGIYLRGSPQVQIWDTSRREVGAQVGSGGLYNNIKNQNKPLVVADNKIGEWNNFHIIMKGPQVTVYLNGVLVTDDVTLENFWDRKSPIFAKEQIELQAHGTYVAYRNIYLREIPSNEITSLTEEEKNQGFVSLFDGTNLDSWTGNTSGYLIEEGAVVVHPDKAGEGGGGNLYTKEEFADFIYRFDFQLTPGANNGIGVHAPLEGDAAYLGMEIQVLDNEADIYKALQPYQYHGSVYGVIPAKRGFLKPTGEWNQEEIMVKGTKIKVTLNGTVILEGDYAEASKNGTMDHKEHPGLLRTTGHIGFLGHGEVLRFKNMRVKVLEEDKKGKKKKKK